MLWKRLWSFNLFKLTTWFWMEITLHIFNYLGCIFVVLWSTWLGCIFIISQIILVIDFSNYKNNFSKINRTIITTDFSIFMFLLWNHLEATFIRNKMWEQKFGFLERAGKVADLLSLFQANSCKGHWKCSPCEALEGS